LFGTEEIEARSPPQDFAGIPVLSRGVRKSPTELTLLSWQNPRWRHREA